MHRHTESLPQSSGGLYLTDAGLETDLIFNRGIEIREFAAHTLLAEPAGRHALMDYFREFVALARTFDTGLVLDAPTWKAHSYWADDLGCTEADLHAANHDAVRLVSRLRRDGATHRQPIVLNAVIGPRGDAYGPGKLLSAAEAEDYHAQQVSWLAETEVQMLTAMTFTHAAEAIGIVRAAARLAIPIVVSFTLETDGTLPSGQALGDAIAEVDRATMSSAAYFMINCAHPDHFRDALDDALWLRRIRGLRCNASRCSHAELDAAETLDDGDPAELGQLYRGIVERMPWVNVLGGCCGSDLRHVTEIVAAVRSVYG